MMISKRTAIVIALAAAFGGAAHAQQGYPYVRPQPQYAPVPHAYPYVTPPRSAHRVARSHHKQKATVAVHDKPLAPMTQDGGTRVIHAEAEVTILGPDRMNIRLYRKRDGLDASAKAVGEKTASETGKD
ncbi:MAG: hypothetical protein OJF62_000165 [Pseudolabrys sp.]|jgi:hypothetical protein|nr:hypothetical protein [Pseudolabrys sp.]